MNNHHEVQHADQKVVVIFDTADGLTTFNQFKGNYEAYCAARAMLTTINKAGNVAYYAPMTRNEFFGTDDQCKSVV